MSGLAVICSGQGSHSAGMLDLAASHEAGRRVLLTFSESFQIDLLARARTGEGLAKNSVAQPMAVATALGNWAVLRDILPEPHLFCGYSVGELSAWACAGTWDTAQSAAVCRMRAKLMERCAPADAAMMAVRGIPVVNMLNVAGEPELHIAIYNEDDHAVLAGPRTALMRAEQRLLASGVWTKLLEVEIPSHTPYLADAAAEFGQWLKEQPTAVPSAPVLLGINAEPGHDSRQGLPALARAICEPIHWQDCMQHIVDAGIRVVLELGPGRSLSAMLQQAHPQLVARAVSDFRTPEGIAAWVGRHLE